MLNLNPKTTCRIKLTLPILLSQSLSSIIWQVKLGFLSIYQSTFSSCCFTSLSYCITFMSHSLFTLPLRKFVSFSNQIFLLFFHFDKPYQWLNGSTCWFRILLTSCKFIFTSWFNSIFLISMLILAIVA